MSAINGATETTAPPGSALETLRVFLKLGLTSFGGPVAHLGNFRAEFVERRKWLDEALTRTDDRALFGLDAIEPAPKPARSRGG